MLTFLIPVRIDSHFRLGNLKTVIQYLKKIPDSTLHVLEADINPKAEETCRGECSYIFIKDSNPIFHRTHYLNMMLKACQTQYAAVWDCDVVTPSNSIAEAIALIENDPKVVISFPYNGCLWDEDEMMSGLFRRTGDIGCFEKYPHLNRLLNGYHAVGGGFVVDVDRYREYGWENENFKGWGPEDLERVKRVEILGGNVARTSGPMFHLYHSRGINSSDIDKVLARSVTEEYLKVCSMSSDELQDYINSWEWIKVNQS